MKENNPQAFPRAIEGMKYKGMTLRDYFAAKAMNALLSQPEIGRFLKENGCETMADSDRQLANTAWRMADAMLKQREL